MLTTGNNYKRGIMMLTLFYLFVIFQNIISWRRFGGNTLAVSVVLGTLLYLIFGFWRREPASRMVGIIFHGIYQVLLTMSIISMAQSQVIKKFVPDLTDAAVPLVQVIMAVVFVVITCINVMSILYLVRNKEYFAEVEERD